MLIAAAPRLGGQGRRLRVEAGVSLGIHRGTSRRMISSRTSIRAVHIAAGAGAGAVDEEA